VGQQEDGKECEGISRKCCRSVTGSAGRGLGVRSGQENCGRGAKSKQKVG